MRRWFVILGGLIIIAGGLAASIEPTWGKFHILRLKQTATLKHVFGDWVRMRDVYSVYMLFLIAVSTCAMPGRRGEGAAPARASRGAPWTGCASTNESTSSFSASATIFVPAGRDRDADRLCDP
jgi:hypothetical protein